jgi:hypothetical protein
VWCFTSCSNGNDNKETLSLRKDLRSKAMNHLDVAIQRWYLIIICLHRSRRSPHRNTRFETMSNITSTEKVSGGSNAEYSRLFKIESRSRKDPFCLSFCSSTKVTAKSVYSASRWFCITSGIFDNNDSIPSPESQFGYFEGTFSISNPHVIHTKPAAWIAQALVHCSPTNLQWYDDSELWHP